MPINEFEKQMQEQLDELQFSPSASVWQNVEGKIKDKKRRRVLVFILLPLLMGTLGISAYFILNNGKSSDLKGQSAKNDQLQSRDHNANNTATKNGTNEFPPIATGQPNAPSETTKNNSDEKGNLDVSRTPGRKIKHQLAPGDKTAIVKHSNSGEKQNLIDKASDISVAVNPPAVDKIPLVQDVQDPVQDAKNAGIPKDSIHIADAAVAKSDSKQDGTSTNQAVRNPDAKQKKQSRIHWGFDLSIGASTNHTEPFSISASTRDAITQVNSPIIAYPRAQAIPPSTIGPGFATMMGAVAEWKISARSSLSSGLKYRYASSMISVGTEGDTTAFSQTASSSFNSSQRFTVYSGPRYNNYVNKYHFLSIPVEYHWLINKQAPLQWDAGVSMDYLIATNALVYSSSFGGVYYKNDEAFNKTHFLVSTGLTYRFRPKMGVEWSVGPQMSFDTRPLTDESGSRQYLLYTTINVRVLFAQKKSK